MQTRNTAIMAVVLVVLAGFVYFYEIRGRGEREEAERVATLLVRFEPEEVTAVEVTTADGAVRATRSDGTWAIVSPVSVPADGEALDTLVDRLHGASHERLVTETAEDLVPFGLAEPEVSVTVELGDAAPVRLAIGKDTPVGANVYASSGDGGSVYSAPRTIKTALAKSLYDLRDRTVLAFDEDAVRAIDLSHGDLRANLQRQDPAAPGADAQWSATEPFTGRADGETIEDLLSELHTGEAAGWVSDAAPSPEDLARFGLDRPAATITLRTDDEAFHRLLIGAAATEPAGRYAMREGGNSVFVIDDTLFESIPTDADSLRNRQVMTVGRERIRNIEIERAGQEALVVQRQGSDWSVTAPRALAADSSSVSRVLSALQDLRAEGFAERAPAGAGVTLRLGLGDDDGPPTETVELVIRGSGTVVPDAEEGEDAEPVEIAYATTSGDSTVYLVPRVDVEDLSPDLFELRAKTLVEFSQGDLTEIDLETVDGTVALRKNGEDWSLEGGAVDSEAVSDLLWDLNFLRMEAVASEWDQTAPTLTPFGLDQPRYRVRARTADGEVADVAIGNEVAGGDEAADRVYARVGERPAVFEVTATLADAIAALLEALQP